MDAVKFFSGFSDFLLKTSQEVATTQEAKIQQKEQELRNVYIVMFNALTKPTYSGNEIVASVRIGNQDYPLRLMGVTEDSEYKVSTCFLGKRETIDNSLEGLTNKLDEFVTNSAPGTAPFNNSDDCL